MGLVWYGQARSGDEWYAPVEYGKVGLGKVGGILGSGSAGLGWAV
jgi:hypothetical protein